MGLFTQLFQFRQTQFGDGNSHHERILGPYRAGFVRGGSSSFNVCDIMYAYIGLRWHRLARTHAFGGVASREASRGEARLSIVLRSPTRFLYLWALGIDQNRPYLLSV